MHEFRAKRCFIETISPNTKPRRAAMQIALFQPDIPQNTGTILRLCACLDMPAHIILPAGFPVSDRMFRRAGRHGSTAGRDARRYGGRVGSGSRPDLVERGLASLRLRDRVWPENSNEPALGLI